MLETEHLVRYKFFFLFFISYSILGQSYPNSKVDNYLKSINIKILNEKYFSADSIITAFKYDFPAMAFPYIYEAANEIARDYNNKVKLNNIKVYAALSKAENIADSLLELHDSTVWNLYQKALVLGYWAYFEGLKENYFSAYDYGRKSLSYFDKCLEIDSTFSDALIANGIFDYWISDKLSWFPLISDKREQAIKTLKYAVVKSSYHQNLGISQLFWILMNEKNFPEARNLIASESDKYPRNRYLLQAYANVERKFDLNHSLSLYQKVLFLTEQMPFYNRIYKIVLLHKIAMVRLSLNERKESLEICDNILSIKDWSSWELKNLSGRLDKIRELRETLRLKGKKN